MADATTNKIMGRPPHDLEVMAKELIEWSFKPDSLNLIGFSSPKRISVTKLPEWAEKDPNFREALTLAKENIAHNRFNAAKADMMPHVFYTRCEGMYDPLYHKYERGEKKYDSDLRKLEESGSKNITVRVDANGLGSGVKVSAEGLPVKSNKGSK